ncbi:MAG: ABC transporter substrate-binding protein [Deltaproteobacteria bacterium]|nr:ABC transporter substrate-binding protein [Deltaproteobacteria bacterium]
MKLSGLVTRGVFFSALACLPVITVAFMMLPAIHPEAQAQQPLRKTTIGISSHTLGHIPLALAKAKGYFRDEGIDLEIVILKAGLNVPAITAGGLDFSGIIGIPINAALKGIRFKVLMVNSGLAMDLVVQPEISSISELKGKRLAIDSFGVYSHTLAEELLRHNGVNPRDVSFTAMGSTPLRLAALRAGTIQGTLLGVPHNFLAEEAGFVRLLSAQELINIPQTGIASLESKILSDPDLVYRLLKGVLKGLLHYRTNKASSIEFMTGFLGLKGSQLAERVYAYSMKVFTEDGIIPSKVQRQAIDESKRATKVTGEVNPEEIFDFHLVRRAKADLSSAGWRP